ncbi:MAG: hypothetical protein ACRDU9_10930, partial [Acidimicrobiia bacterium]
VRRSSAPSMVIGGIVVVVVGGMVVVVVELEVVVDGSVVVGAASSGLQAVIARAMARRSAVGRRDIVGNVGFWWTDSTRWPGTVGLARYL